MNSNLDFHQQIFFFNFFILPPFSIGMLALSLVCGSLECKSFNLPNTQKVNKLSLSLSLSLLYPELIDFLIIYMKCEIKCCQERDNGYLQKQKAKIKSTLSLHLDSWRNQTLFNFLFLSAQHLATLHLYSLFFFIFSFLYGCSSIYPFLCFSFYCRTSLVSVSHFHLQTYYSSSPILQSTTQPLVIVAN